MITRMGSHFLVSALLGSTCIYIGYVHVHVCTPRASVCELRVRLCTQVHALILVMVADLAVRPTTIKLVSLPPPSPNDVMPNWITPPLSVLTHLP